MLAALGARLDAAWRDADSDEERELLGELALACGKHSRRR
jgi:hypothetical protein